MPKLLTDGSGDRESDTALWIASRVREGLVELRGAYPAMLTRLREILLAELQVPNISPAMLEGLRDRAENVRDLGATIAWRHS